MVTNSVFLIGRLTKEPELRYTQNDMAVCKFSLAVDRIGKEKESDFPSCVAFGKTAETIGKYVGKGCRVAVSGSIRTGSYEGKNGKVYTTDVVVTDINIIDFRDSGKGYKEEPKAAFTPKERFTPKEEQFVPANEMDEDLPF